MSMRTIRKSKSVRKETAEMLMCKPRLMVPDVSHQGIPFTIKKLEWPLLLLLFMVTFMVLADGGGPSKPSRSFKRKENALRAKGGRRGVKGGRGGEGGGRKSFLATGMFRK